MNRSAARDWTPAIVVFVVVLVAWEVSLFALGVQSFLIPRPSVIAGSMVTEWPTLIKGVLFTGAEAVGGLIVGVSLGTLAGLATARWASARDLLLPVAIGASAIPIIAFAPITNNWFGLLNPISKMAIAAVLCFFPTMINTLRGLITVSPSSIELMRSYAGGELATFRRVRIPSSLPFMFSGLKIAAVLSMIGAIVGEYFGGPTNALGVSILNDSQLFNFPRAWAGIMLASAFGIGLYAAVAAVERATTSWHPSARSIAME